MLDVTDTQPVVSGGMQIEMMYPTLTVDNIGVYKSSIITCTGLPAGYKLRVGTITATASSGTATVDYSAVSFPVTSVEVLNASNVVVDTITPADGVWGGDACSYQSLIAVSIGAPVVDSRRRVQATAQDRTDTVRKVKKLVESLTDSKRRTSAVVFVVSDTARNSIRRYFDVYVWSQALRMP